MKVKSYQHENDHERWLYLNPDSELPSPALSGNGWVPMPDAVIDLGDKDVLGINRWLMAEDFGLGFHHDTHERPTLQRRGWKVRVHGFKFEQTTTSGYVLQSHKRTLGGIEVRAGEVVPGTEERVPVEALDNQGAYLPPS